MLSTGAPGNSTDKQHQFLFVEAERSSEVKENVTGDLIQRYSRAKQITTVNLKRPKFNKYHQMLISSTNEDDMTVNTLKFSKIGKTLRKYADIFNIW